MEGLIPGKSWSGQFPLRKKSGEIFMAIVTKSLLYEEGEHVGVITVSSDASVFNNINSQHLRVNYSQSNGQSRDGESHPKKIQWIPRPQITSAPQVASSVSSLVLTHTSLVQMDVLFHISDFSHCNKICINYQASKVLSFKRGTDNAHQNSNEETLSHGKVSFGTLK